ncbi:metallophosphoesterase [Streptomyces sp. NPDC055085]
MTKLIVVVADLQLPFHDPNYIRLMEKFIRERKPDEVGQIGDFYDSPGVGRWNKGAAGEYRHNLKKDKLKGLEIIERLQIDWIQYGNHDLRYEQYITQYAPAIDAFLDDEIRFERVFGLDDAGVVLKREPWSIARGWMVAHGHEHKRISPIAGSTAFSLAKKLDRNVMTGHTHRAGIRQSTQGGKFGVPSRTLTGIEIGHGMRVSAASYVNAPPDWQQAFGYFYVDGQRAQAGFVPIVNSSFFFEGRVWKL